MVKKDKEMLEYLSTSDINRLYGFGTSTIWRWVKEGFFPKPVRIGKRWTRWKKEDVEAFLARHAENSK